MVLRAWRCGVAAAHAHTCRRVLPGLHVHVVHVARSSAVLSCAG